MTELLKLGLLKISDSDDLIFRRLSSSVS